MPPEALKLLHEQSAYVFDQIWHPEPLEAPGAALEPSTLFTCPYCRQSIDTEYSVNYADERICTACYDRAIVPDDAAREQTNEVTI